MSRELRLVVDANIFVAEALRVRGRELLARTSITLFAAAEPVDEARYETNKRILLLESRGSITTALAEALRTSIEAVFRCIFIVEQDVYESHLDDAAIRIPADPADARSIALALFLGCGIWTSDRDFFGSGVATWSTDVIRAVLGQSDDRPPTPLN